MPFRRSMFLKKVFKEDQSRAWKKAMKEKTKKELISQKEQKRVRDARTKVSKALKVSQEVLKS